MSRRSTALALTPEDRIALESWVRAAGTDPRLADRARIILAAAEGESSVRIARALSLRAATVSKWRVRFSRAGLRGLQDELRPGASPRYGGEAERRILAKLQERPPDGQPTWTGSLVAGALGDVSKHQVWRVLRAHGRHLQRRRTWYIRTEVQFAAKATGIGALYLDPPENAIVLAVAESPRIPSPHRAEGYVKLPHGKAAPVRRRDAGAASKTTLLGALELLSGRMASRRRDVLAFLDKVAAAHPSQELHVILDEVTRKPRHDRWLARHSNVSLHFAPSHASWLHQIECWFSILGRRSAPGDRSPSPRQIRDAIERFIEASGPDSVPFEWTTTA